MAGYCRICHDQNRGNNDPLVACNKCGSLACDMHHTWWSNTKNAYCTECYPKQLINSLSNTAAGLTAITENNMAREFYEPVIRGCLKDRELSLEELVRVLHLLIHEVTRRMNQIEGLNNDRENEA